MRIISHLLAAPLAAFMLFCTPSQADETRGALALSDDSAVWSVVERAWRAERDGSKRWIDNLLSADFVGWNNAAPAPRDKGSTRLWNTFNARQNGMIEYELYPLSIIVHGDTAIAHYLFTSATQEKGKQVATVNGRYTDVLVRSADGWRFLAWHGGPSAR